MAMAPNRFLFPQIKFRSYPTWPTSLPIANVSVEA